MPPDYLPPLNLPEGMAEKLIELKSQSGNPWAALAQNLGNNVSQSVQAIGQARQNRPLTPEQLASLKAGQIPAGLTRQQQLQVGSEQSSLAERMAASKEATNRTVLGKELGLEGTHTTYTPEMWDKLSSENKKKLEGLGLGPGIAIPNQLIASQIKPPAASSDQNLSQDEQNALVKATMRSDNPLAPSMISFRGPRAKTMAQALMKDPNWSPNKAEAGLAGVKAGASAAARFDESGPGQMVARVANSAMEQLDALQKASDSFPRSNVQMLNTPIMKIDEQTMPEAQDWKIALNTARMEYATALNRGNSPELENIAEATKALPDSITMKQLPSAIKQLRLGLTNTVKGMTTRVAPKGDKKSGQSDKAPHEMSDDELLKALGQ